jgi:hypothetical protein
MTLYYAHLRVKVKVIEKDFSIIFQGRPFRMAERKPDEIKGKAQKGAGGRDAKRQKANKNITSALVDRNKEAKAVSDVTREMQEIGDTIFEPWQRNVIKLQAQGWSFEKIIEHGEKKRKQTGMHHPKRIVWPSRTLLYKALGNLPEFKEATEKAFAFAVDAEAQRTLELTKSLDSIEGLKPYELVQARDKRIQRTLQVAGRIMPDKWGEQSEGDREVIVFEPYGGWIPTNTIKGAPGQGSEGESAAERWRKMREEAKDA